MEIDILGIAMAKSVFRVHGADLHGRTVYTANVRAASLETVRKSRPRIIAMEACGSAHHWA
jgi:transposase